MFQDCLYLELKEVGDLIFQKEKIVRKINENTFTEYRKNSKEITCIYFQTMKKKLFVLREESENGPARLEYYDNEKKFVCGRPKRSIHLHNCFSINAKADSKHKYVIVLYTREDSFTVICENEADHKEWLSAMISLRNYHTHGSATFPLYGNLVY